MEINQQPSNKDDHDNEHIYIVTCNTEISDINCLDDDKTQEDIPNDVHCSDESALKDDGIDNIINHQSSDQKYHDNGNIYIVTCSPEISDSNSLDDDNTQVDIKNDFPSNQDELHYSDNIESTLNCDAVGIDNFLNCNPYLSVMEDDVYEDISYGAATGDVYQMTDNVFVNEKKKSESSRVSLIYVVVVAICFVMTVLSVGLIIYFAQFRQKEVLRISAGKADVIALIQMFIELISRANLIHNMSILK